MFGSIIINFLLFQHFNFKDFFFKRYNFCIESIQCLSKYSWPNKTKEESGSPSLGIQFSQTENDDNEMKKMKNVSIARFEIVIDIFNFLKRH